MAKRQEISPQTIAKIYRERGEPGLYDFLTFRRAQKGEVIAREIAQKPDLTSVAQESSPQQQGEVYQKPEEAVLRGENLLARVRTASGVHISYFTMISHLTAFSGLDRGPGKKVKYILPESKVPEFAEYVKQHFGKRPEKNSSTRQKKEKIPPFFSQVYLNSDYVRALPSETSFAGKISEEVLPRTEAGIKAFVEFMKIYAYRKPAVLELSRMTGLSPVTVASYFPELPGARNIGKPETPVWIFDSSQYKSAADYLSGKSRPKPELRGPRKKIQEAGAPPHQPTVSIPATPSNLNPEQVTPSPANIQPPQSPVKKRDWFLDYVPSSQAMLWHTFIAKALEISAGTFVSKMLDALADPPQPEGRDGQKFYLLSPDHRSLMRSHEKDLGLNFDLLEERVKGSLVNVKCVDLRFSREKVQAERGRIGVKYIGRTLTGSPIVLEEDAIRLCETLSAQPS